MASRNGLSFINSSSCPSLCCIGPKTRIVRSPPRISVSRASVIERTAWIRPGAATSTWRATLPGMELVASTRRAPSRRTTINSVWVSDSNWSRTSSGISSSRSFSRASDAASPVTKWSASQVRRKLATEGMKTKISVSMITTMVRISSLPDNPLGTYQRLRPLPAPACLSSLLPSDALTGTGLSRLRFGSALRGRW